MDEAQAKKRRPQHSSFSPRRNDRKERNDKSALLRPKQYTDLDMTINNIFHNIKDKPFLKQPKLIPKHLAKKKSNEYCSFH